MMAPVNQVPAPPAGTGAVVSSALRLPRREASLNSGPAGTQHAGPPFPASMRGPGLQGVSCHEGPFEQLRAHPWTRAAWKADTLNALKVAVAPVTIEFSIFNTRTSGQATTAGVAPGPTSYLSRAKPEESAGPKQLGRLAGRQPRSGAAGRRQSGADPGSRAAVGRLTAGGRHPLSGVTGRRDGHLNPNPEAMAMPMGCARSGHMGEKDRRFHSHSTERRGRRPVPRRRDSRERPATSSLLCQRRARRCHGCGTPTSFIASGRWRCPTSRSAPEPMHPEHARGVRRRLRGRRLPTGADLTGGLPC